MYNEAAGIAQFHTSLMAVLKDAPMEYEVLYVDDGSTDGSAKAVAGFCEADIRVHLLKLSRNFGKEIATTAGINRVEGDAILILDADGQHPVDRIPEFVKRWKAGAKVVVGRRTDRQMGIGKRLSTKFFYGVFQRLTGVRIDPDTSDFRLIDKEVQAQFNKLTEHNRMTKALIDWLGYEREYVAYAENPRLQGDATYSYRKLFKLAIDSAISLSISPLYITAYIGAIVLPIATALGLGMGLDYIFGDPLRLHATGGAYLTVFMLFLVGILLVSQGIIGLYLSHIHTETQNRPLYVVDEINSKG